MPRDSGALADELRSVAERIADEAITTLRAAMRADTPEEQAELRATEKKLTRARRSVEKAIHLLEGVDVD